MKHTLDQFADARITGLEIVTGGGCKSYCPPPPCDEPETKAKGNNGIGQEKRGILDGPPPGLAAQERQDFNDRSGNRHGVEV
ncbi:MAG: hypothetical protein KDN18_06785 [Verrucomicrobiae bacterium]|nr:hypothetical protein [Verrucomicrobiae bacterium]